MKKIIFLILSVIAIMGYSQNNKTFFVRGFTEKSDSKTNEAKRKGFAAITLYKNDVKINDYKSDKNGDFEITGLDYNNQYKVVFSATGCIEMYMTIDANLPPNAVIKSEGIDLNYTFYDIKEKGIDKDKFVYPIYKIFYSAKEKGLMPDRKYTEGFINGVIPPEMKNAYAKEQADKLNKENEAAQAIEKQKQATAAALAEKESKKIKIAGKLVVGENPSKPVANVALNLLDNNGTLVQTVTTNFLGAFVFYISPDNDYSFFGQDVTVVSANSKVIFTNKNDKEVKSNTADNTGKFKFDLLRSDAGLIPALIVADADLKMDLKGKFLSSDGSINKPIADLKVNLLNPLSELVQQAVTDKDGRFTFNYVSTTENYTITLDESNPALASSVKKIIMENEKGEVMKVAAGNKMSDFKFEILPLEKSKMSRMYVDDPWLKIVNLSGTSNKSFEQVITERVYFNVNDDKILPEAQKVLDKVIAVMKISLAISIELSSHTDATGADDYNLKLSERRAKAAVDYMVKNGIAANRLIGKGYGETHLLNKCDNSVRCTEDEHAQNRRLEFKVLKK